MESLTVVESQADFGRTRSEAVIAVVSVTPGSRVPMLSGSLPASLVWKSHQVPAVFVLIGAIHLEIGRLPEGDMIP